MNQEITLNKNESNHLINVMRSKIGDSTIIIDGCGCVADSTIISYLNKQVTLIIKKIECIKKNPVTLSIIVPVLKNQNTDYIIREATAIGVHEIYPAWLDQCDFKINKEKIAKKEQDWLECCIEGCKQSGNAFIPTINQLDKFENVVKSFDDNAVKLFGGLSTHSENLLSVLCQHKLSKNFIVAIGPEGDFSTSEYDKLRANNFVEVALASNVLRSETAAIYSLSVIDNFIGTVK